MAGIAARESIMYIIGIAAKMPFNKYQPLTKYNIELRFFYEYPLGRPLGPEPKRPRRLSNPNSSRMKQTNCKTATSLMVQTHSSSLPLSCQVKQMDDDWVSVGKAFSSTEKYRDYRCNLRNYGIILFCERK